MNDNCCGNTQSTVGNAISDQARRSKPVSRGPVWSLLQFLSLDSCLEFLPQLLLPKFAFGHRVLSRGTYFFPLNKYFNLFFDNFICVYDLFFLSYPPLTRIPFYDPVFALSLASLWSSPSYIMALTSAETQRCFPQSLYFLPGLLSTCYLASYLITEPFRPAARAPTSPSANSL